MISAIASRIIRLLTAISFAVTLMFMTYLTYQPVSARTETCSEELLRIKGVLVVNCSGESFCPTTPNTAASSASVPLPGSRVYLLGDSISVLSEANVRESIENRGYTISGYNADSGRAITYDSGGGDPTGLQAIETDANIIRESDVVIVALGTNSGNEDLSVQIPTLVQSLRNTGFSGRLYWVDLFYTSGSGPSVRNGVINNLSTELAYTVIRTSDKAIELETDGVHPTPANGFQQFATTIADSLATIAAPINLSAPNSDGQCQCIPATNTISINNRITWGTGVWGSGSDLYESGLSGPYTVEQWAIHVLKNISRKSGISESVLLTKDKVVSLVAWSRAEGGGINGNNGTFNPLNTKLDHEDLQGVNQGDASTDSNSQGYPSFDIGVEGITRGLFGTFQKRIGSALLDSNFSKEAFIEAIAGDFYSPDGVTTINRLENIYPGDRIWAALSVTGFDYGGGIGDRDRYLSIMRDTLRNVTEDYERYAGVVLDGSPAGTPEPLLFSGTGSGGVTYSGEACSQEGGGSVNTEGYSFPLAPQTKAGIGGISEGQVVSGHWDQTAAFDLFGPPSADVYALYAGTPVRINTSFNDVEGCTSIQFKADDGFYYFYGHLKNPVVVEDERIEAGTKMAQVADASFGTECSGNGGPHLHIDRGCTTEEGPQWAGNKDCRDPKFIELLSKIYETLP